MRISDWSSDVCSSDLLDRGDGLTTHMVRPILYLTRKWPPAVGGMETYSDKLPQALARCADIPVSVIAFPGRRHRQPPTATSLLVLGGLAPFRPLLQYRPPPLTPFCPLPAGHVVC